MNVQNFSNNRRNVPCADFGPDSQDLNSEESLLPQCSLYNVLNRELYFQDLRTHYMATVVNCLHLVTSIPG